MSASAIDIMIKQFQEMSVTPDLLSEEGSEEELSEELDPIVSVAIATLFGSNGFLQGVDSCSQLFNPKEAFTAYHDAVALHGREKMSGLVKLLEGSLPPLPSSLEKEYISQKKSPLFFSFRVVDSTLDPNRPYDYSRLIHTLNILCLEYYLFREMFRPMEIVQKEIETRRELVACGYKYVSIPGSAAHIGAPECANTIPWPVLFLRCKLSYLEQHQLHFQENTDKFTHLLQQILNAQERFPDFQKFLHNLFIEAKNFECICNLTGKLEKVIATLDGLLKEKKIIERDFEYPVALSFFIDSYQGWKECFQGLQEKTKEQVAGDISVEEKMALSIQWDDLFLDLITLYNKARAMYYSPENMKNTLEVYGNVYEKMDRYYKDMYRTKGACKAARRGCGIQEYFPTLSDRPLFCGLNFSFPFPKVFSSPPSSLALLSEKALGEKAPEKISERLPKGKAKKSHPPARKASSKNHHRSHKGNKHQHRFPASKEPVEQPKKEVEEQVAPSPVAGLSVKDKIASIAPSVTKKEIRTVLPSAQSFPIKIGEKPGNFHYARSVRRWTFENPFATDPVYREPHYSPEVQAAIRFEHDFAHVIHKLCFLFGTRFEKKTPQGALDYVSYVLPGEAFWDDSRYEKMLFEICYDSRTKRIFHAYAAKRSPLQLIERYAKNQCFQEDAPATVSPKEEETSQGHEDLLPDDRSSVTDFHLNSGANDREEFFEVRDPKFGVTIRLWRFPV